MRSDVAHVDVLVVGLGPAGASAALEAARAGHRVLAVERRRVAGTPVQCAELVPAMLASEVAAVARCAQQTVDAMCTFVERDSPDIEPDFPGYMLDRATFDAVLVEEAIAAGARCACGVAARIDGDGRVRLSDGSTIEARVIVGADGPRSIVGRAIGAVNRECAEARQITVRLLSPQSSTDIFLSATIPGGYGWLFPKREVANLGAGVMACHRDALKSIVAMLHAELVAEGVVGARVLGTTGGAIPVGGMLQPTGSIDDALVFLAGDAAGLTNPITGAGIASAVLSGRMAGRAAAAHLAGDADAAADYEEDLRALFGPTLARALRHRAELDAVWREQGAPSKAMLRRSWIAYPEYWAARAPADAEVIA